MSRTALAGRMSAAVLALSAVAACPARAEADAMAVGVAAAWQERADYGEDTRASFAPELVGFGYVPVGGGRLYLRPGARLGHAGLSRPEMPNALRIAERDVSVAGEIGLVRDGAVVPSLTIGAGAVSRWIRLETSPPVSAPDERISRHQLLGTFHAQVGFGIPLAGRFLIEPFVRFESVRADDRGHWRYGVELTARVF